ncbi:MAG: glycosyltransferase family 4 protein [Candidatus Nanoarchaeia archaeon]
MKILFVTHSASSHHKIMNLYSEIADKLIVLANIKNKSNLDYEFPKVKNKEKVRVVFFEGIMDGIRKARNITKEEDIDVVTSHCPISGYIASKTNKKHVFVMCQDYIEYLEASNVNTLSKIVKKQALKFLLKKAFKRANVVALSDHIKRRAEAYGATRIANIPVYGVDTKLFRKKPKDKKLMKELGLENKKVVLTVTRLTPEKGTEYLIKAMKQIREKFEAKLIICGKGYDENRLRKMCEELGLKNDVVFAGFIEYTEMPKYYNLCDVFVLPSIKEGLGFASGEALSCGKPVVASDTGGIPDIVNEKTGILVKPGDYQGIAEAVIKLLHERKLAEQLVRNGQENIKRNFDEKIVNKKFTELIKNAI